MGIFKKTKPQEIPIKPSISDSEREAERLRQLEASLDFLRDKPSPPPQKTVTPGNPAAAVQNENRNSNADRNLKDSQDSKEAGLEKVITNETGNGADNPETANLNENHAATVNSDNDVNQKESLQKNNTSDAVLQETAASKESNSNLNPKESEEAEAARQKAIRNKYGRRMDYKTAKVSTAGLNSNSSASTVSNNTAYSNRVTTKAPADKTSELPEADHVSSVVNTEVVSTAISQNNDAAAAVSRAVLPANSEKMTADNAAAEFTGKKPQDREAQNSTERKETDTLNETVKANPEETAAGKPAETPVKEPSMAIQNPLPTPAKHAHREMEFDIMPSPEEMHFDLVDLSGIDFFDIN